MTTQTFATAKDAKFLKVQPCEIKKINGYDVIRGYVNITNKHITVEDNRGIKVFRAPFEITYHQ